MQETLHKALSMRDGHLRTACSTLGKVSRMPPETAQNSKRHLAEHFQVASEPLSLSSCCVVADSNSTFLLGAASACGRNTAKRYGKSRSRNIRFCEVKVSA